MGRLLGLVLFALCASAVAQDTEELAPPVVVGEDLERIELGPHLALLEDPGGNYGIEDVVRPELAQAFQPTRGKSPNFGFTPSAWWVRVVLENPGDAPRRALLRQDYPLIDYLDLWVSREDGGWDHRATGDRRPFDSRDVAHRDFIFPIELAPGESRTLYLRFASGGPVNIGLALYRDARLMQAISAEQLAYGIYYGGFIVLVFYNFFIFLVVKDRAFLFYLLYVCSYGLYMAVHNGLTYQFFWPGSPAWGNFALILLLASTLIFGLEFSRSFLNLRQRAPIQNRIAWILQAAVVVCFIYGCFASYASTIAPLAGLTLLVTVHIMFMGTSSLVSGYRPARFFMLAWTMLLVGVIIYMLKSFGLLPHNAFTQNAFQIGSLVEMVLLALALASRVRELQRQTLTDPLTGLGNRRVFDELLIYHFDRARRMGLPLSLLMIDIDHFKAFNDRLGHARGDDALQMVADLLRQSTRKPHTVTRYGGEEFAIILPATPREAAEYLAERLRQKIQSSPLDNEKLTVSIGVASITDADFADETQFFQAADAALYKAKEAGRNRVVHYDALQELRA